MIERLNQIEKAIKEYSEESKLSEGEKLIFPEYWKRIYDYQVFGENLLSIPAYLYTDDVNEFETPFSFLNQSEVLKIFESEFRQEVPNEFVQIGSFYGGSEIVLLNKIRDTIHFFNVADIVDKSWMKFKLEKEICSYQIFIEKIEIQTVCCTINPNNYSEYELFQIRSETELRSNNEVLVYSDKEETWKEYRDQISHSLKKGFKIHYAPKKLLMEIKR